MSISERERQALGSIESEIAHTAPQLASMLVMFSRLTADEEMPAREPGGPAAAAWRAGPRRVWRWRIGRKARGWLLLAVAAALFAVAMALTHGVRVSPCTTSLTIACKQAPSVPQGRGR